MKEERITNQREAILEYLSKVKSHPTAETVYKEVKKKLPRISMATVYRNLKNLSKAREIVEIPSAESHYDGDISNHAHFMCSKCNKIYDIFNLCRECKIVRTKKIKVGNINRFQIYFYGECKKCKK